MSWGGISIEDTPHISTTLYSPEALRLHGLEPGAAMQNPVLKKLLH